jgi:molybdate transport system ATP-binding protein
VLLLDEPLSALDTRTRARAARELAALLRDASVPALLVTHDFGEAALLGDRVAVIDAGRIVQEGSARELAAAPASAFVADLTGAVVMLGEAEAGRDGLTLVRIDGGGEVASTDPGRGRVAVSVHPWEIALAAASADAVGSAQNRLLGTVSSVTHVGNRVRVGVEAGQPLVAEVTEPAVRELGLRPGVRVAASWKAAATRLVAL